MKCQQSAKHVNGVTSNIKLILQGVFWSSVYVFVVLQVQRTIRVPECFKNTVKSYRKSTGRVQHALRRCTEIEEAIRDRGSNCTCAEISILHVEYDKAQDLLNAAHDEQRKAQHSLNIERARGANFSFIFYELADEWVKRPINKCKEIASNVVGLCTRSEGVITGVVSGIWVVFFSFSITIIFSPVLIGYSFIETYSISIAYILHQWVSIIILSFFITPALSYISFWWYIIGLPFLRYTAF